MAIENMKLVSVAEMVAIEQQADAAGLTYEHMMENAGAGLAEIIQDLPIEADQRMILGLVGPGNNGGDTLVALSLLASAGWQVRAYLVKREPDALVSRLLKAGGRVVGVMDEGRAELESLMSSSAILLDGLLGTGSKPPVRGEVGAVIMETNRLLSTMDGTPYVVAVDCPSGVDCDTGATPDDCIAADLTVTLAAVKQGLLEMPAYEYAGDLMVVDIGLPADLSSLQAVRTEVVEEDLVAALLPKRSALAHKGTFGTALIAAGSVNYTGAALLAGSAAYRAGAGLVTLAVPAPLHAALAGRLPEATWLLLPHELGVISRDATGVLVDGIGSSTAMLVGPGLGTEATTEEFVSSLLASGVRAPKAATQIGFLGARRGDGTAANGRLPALVVDADGLKLLARMKDWHMMLPNEAVLTPHPGEMALLTGQSKDEIQKDRRRVAARFAEVWGHVVVLKGAFTVIAAPDGRLAVVPIATAALARAGTGDVLAGLIVGLRAQGVPAYESALAGAWIHAEAGLHAARRIGNAASVLAGDVLDSIADVISALPPA
jgi:NAD(P)H-hydrate epimerase